MTTKWSEQAWQAALPVYYAILKHPFIEELAKGTLPLQKFTYYLEQDWLYINNYCRVLAHIASRLDQGAMTEAFLNFANEGVLVEKTMHAGFLKGNTPARGKMSPTCLLYTSVLNSAGSDDVAVEAAAVLPCFWIYLCVGQHIASASSSGNPYSRWIATYSDPSFRASTQRAIKICDTLAAEASESTRRRMTEIFALCAKMEWMFWDSSYNLEKWKI